MKKWIFFLVLPLFLAACGSDSKIVQGPAGTPGPSGASAPTSPYDVVEYIYPCGQQSQNDEVLFKLANGSIEMSLNAHDQAYFVIVAPGDYVTSDSKHCRFTVHSDNTVTW